MAITSPIFTYIMCNTLGEAASKPIKLFHERRVYPGLWTACTQCALAALDSHKQVVALRLGLGTWC